MATLEQLSEEVSQAAKQWQAARDRLNEAEGQHLRFRLLALADADVAIEGFSFSVESEYNDEGGYYDSATVYQKPEPEDDEPLYEITDYGYETAAIALAFGLAGDEREGEATVAALRALEPEPTVSV